MNCRGICVFLLLIGCCYSQDRVDARSRYERVLAVVPLVGTGNGADARRPLHAPERLSPAGIIAWSCQPADTSALAVCEFVARDRKALLPILNDSRIAGRVFDKTRSAKADIEREIRKHKRDFDLERWQVVAQ